MATLRSNSLSNAPAEQYIWRVSPQFRKHNKHPHAYLGEVLSLTAHPSPVDGAAGAPEHKVIWRSGDQRQRTVALLMCQAEVIRLRLEALTTADRHYAEHLAATARSSTWPDGRHKSFTMKGRQHSPETKAKMSASARAAWAAGQRSPPTWLNPSTVEQPKSKAPPLRLVIGAKSAKSAEDERRVRRSD